MDLDGDGCTDILSGSYSRQGESMAGLFQVLWGTRDGKFRKAQALTDGDGELGDTLSRPGSDTRLWADDVDGDGRLDLLVGDNVTLTFPAKGVDEETARRRLGEWNEKQKKVFESMQAEPSPEEQRKFDAAYEALQEERKQFVQDERTGFVWLLVRK